MIDEVAADVVVDVAVIAADATGDAASVAAGAVGGAVDNLFEAVSSDAVSLGRGDAVALSVVIAASNTLAAFIVVVVVVAADSKASLTCSPPAPVLLSSIFPSSSVGLWSSDDCDLMRCFRIASLRR